MPENTTNEHTALFFNAEGVLTTGNRGTSYTSQANMDIIEKNMHVYPFYDPNVIKAHNGEEYLILVANAVMTPSDYNYRIDITTMPNSKLTANPLVHAIQSTDLLEDTFMDDEEMRAFFHKKGQLNIEGEVDMNSLYRYSGRDIHTNIKPLGRDDSTTLFSNDAVLRNIFVNNAISTLTDPIRSSLYMMYVIDKHGNIFMLDTSFRPMELVINNLGKIVRDGLKEFVTTNASTLPILDKYLDDRGIEKFDVREFDPMDIRDDSTFSHRFAKSYNAFKIKKRTTYKKDGDPVVQMRRSVDSGMIRYEIGSSIYMITREPERMKKEYFSILYGIPKTKITTDNMYDFIDESTITNYVGNFNAVDNDIFEGKVAEKPFLFDLVYNEATPVVAELYLYYIYANKHNIQLYHEFDIYDERGKKRTINAPNEELKAICKRMNVLLSNSAESNIKRRGLDNVIMGYRKGKNIQNNAEQHMNNKHVIKADFKDYFNSIKYGDCRNTLKFIARPHKGSAKIDEEYKDKYSTKRKLVDSPWNRQDYYYDNAIEKVFKKTLFNPYTNGLYMGNPVSGALSNLAILKVAQYIYNITNNKGITFTIYADDLTFSIPEKDRSVLNKKYINYIIEDVVLEKYSEMYLQLKPSKTIEMNNQKRRITGITLNHDNEVTWDRGKYRLLRSALHRLDVTNDMGQITMNRSQLRGNVNFFNYTEETNGVDGKINKLLTRYRDTLIRNGVFNGEEMNNMITHTKREESEV